MTTQPIKKLADLLAQLTDTTKELIELTEEIEQRVTALENAAAGD